ncbi:MAG: hypothetical protein ACTHNU_01590 [Gaiellales bacterium]
MSGTPEAAGGERLNTDRVVPRWVGIAFALAAALLAPWTVWIAWTLPDRHLAAHWSIAWGGFDLALAAALAATGFAVLRRSWLIPIVATMAATMLLCDAWFDVVTARGRMTLGVAVVEAMFAELPLAVVCLWIAINVETVLADRRPYLQRAGFRVPARTSSGPDDGDVGVDTV